MGKKSGNGSRSAWLTSPAVDLMVGCGAWSAPLLLLVYPLGQRFDLAVGFAFYALSVFCNYPHYMATIYRAYRTRDEFSKYRFFTLYATALLAAVAAVVHVAPWLLPVFFTVFITWSPWHYTGQNFGIAMLFARRSGAEPTRPERNWLYLSFAASYAMIFLSIHSGASVEPYVVSLGIPMAIGNVARLALLLVFAGAALRALIPMVLRTSARAMLAPIVVASTQFLWFVLPGMLELGLGWQVPRTSYSVGVLAFMHCAQYLWITRYYAEREANAEAAPDQKARTWRPWTYYAVLVVGGIALFIPGPWLVSYAFKFDFSATFLIFTALVNIHHFLVDGAIWKLRDGRVAALLIGKGEKAEQRTHGWNLVRAFGGSESLYRAARIAATAALLVLAGFDQLRFYFSLDRTNVASLLKAARLNPFDVVVQTGIARAKADTGAVDEAVDELKRAIAIDPYNAVAQRALAQILLENRRYDEAYAHHVQMAAHIPLDADSLVNFGTLAAQSGKTDQAISCWNGALALDNSLPLPHLYLADTFAQSGRDAEAIPHYERYIALESARGAAIEPTLFIGVLKRVGDAYGRTNNYERSGYYYSQMLAFAQRAADPGLEAQAQDRLGTLAEASGDFAQASQRYQRALDLLNKSSDSAGLAVEWIAYARFLEKAKAPVRLRAAALLAARRRLAETPNPDLSSIDREIDRIANESPADVAAVRADPDRASTEALAFTPATTPATAQ